MLLAYAGFWAPVDWPTLECSPWLKLGLFTAVALHCLLRPRDPRSTLLWLFITWALPVPGALFYLTVGINRVREKVWQKHRSDQTFRSTRALHEQEERPLAYWRGIRDGMQARPADPPARALNAYLDRLAPDHPLLGGNDVQVLVDAPEAFPAMFDAIRGARHHIHLQTFILGADATGRELLDALAARAAAGVQVRVLYDAFGSARARLRGFFRAYSGRPCLRIEDFTQVNPLRRRFQLNLRNHRKILVVDGAVGFTGGMNFYDAYRAHAGGGATHDYHFRVAGPAVLELQYSFLRDWYYMTDEDPERLLAPVYFPPVPPAGRVPVRLLNSGPTASESESLLDALFAAITGAQRQILLVTPYFVPPDEIRRALRCAALRGVTVKVLVPAVNNHFYVGYASQSLYDSLLESGVRIFELPPPFLHAKAALVDDALAFVGSANLDARSLRLNYETTLVAFDGDFATALKRVVLDDFARATELSLAEWRTRPLRRRLVENFCSLLSPVA